MSDLGTVTDWLREFQHGDQHAADRLVTRYFERLVAMSRDEYRKQFGDIPRPVEDEEDAAASAMASFCAAVQDGKIQDVVNRQQLWKLLAKITIRKLYDQRERAQALKRGGGQHAAAPETMEEIVADVTGPQAEAEMRDTYYHAMALLGDSELRRIAELALLGRTRADIADALSVTPRTVYRKLKLIEDKWEIGFPKIREVLRPQADAHL
jgi:hypothetical protein